MSVLDRIISDEHDMVVHSTLTWDRFAVSVFDILRKNLPEDEYLKTEPIVAGCFNDVEDFAFTQSFIRGIAAVKGGII